jgi:flavin-dependent dehydrogenase
MNPFGQGRHLNRSDFEEILRTTVKNCTSRLALERGKFKNIHRTPDGLWNIEMDVKGERKSVAAKWVVDATGRKASVATKVIGSFYEYFVSIHIALLSARSKNIYTQSTPRILCHLCCSYI